MLLDASAYFQQERVVCSIQAAQQYQIPALVLLAVAEQEGGKPGQRVRNRNGTFDYGAMQINTVSLADLRRFGIQEKHVLTKGCYPYFLAAWRIAGHLKKDSGDIWQRAANYHSRTPHFNRIYRAGLLRKAAKIADHFSFVKKPTDGVAIESLNQITPIDNKVTLQPHANHFSAYSAPIRVRSFDSLHGSALQATDLRSIPIAPNTVWAGQPLIENGW